MFKQKVTLSLFVSIHIAQHDSYTKLKIWYLSHAIFVNPNIFNNLQARRILVFSSHLPVYPT